VNTDLIDKLWEKTKIVNGCWLYKDDNKYAWVWYNRSSWMVHRLAVSVYFKVPYKGNWIACHVDELCSNKNCWNPAHLYKGTMKTNTIDIVKSGKHHSASRTHCPRGHEYTEANTYRSPSGDRICRACKPINKRIWYNKT